MGITLHELSRSDARWVAAVGPISRPILYGDQLVGKLDAIADHSAGAVRVPEIHQDVPFTRAMTTAVGHEIEDLVSCA